MPNPENQSTPSYFEAFRLQRKPRNLRLPDDVRRTIRTQFPETRIHSPSKTSLGIVSRHETKRMLTLSGILDRRSMFSIVSDLIDIRRQDTKEDIDLPIKGINTVNSVGGEQKISVIFDDIDGFVEEDRSSYLNKLSQITGIGVEEYDYMPDLTLGTIPAEASREAKITVLDYVRRTLPEVVTFGKVRPSPTFGELSQEGR